MQHNYFNQRGISLLEVFLVLGLAALILLMGFRQYSQYKWTRDVTQIQQSVTQLLQAADVYYYANCSSSFKVIIGQPLSCADFVSAGAFRDNDQCNKTLTNPWGQAFQVSIISLTASGETASYGLAVSAALTKFSGNNSLLKQMASLLGGVWQGDGAVIVWTRLPTASISHIQVGVIAPNGWVPVISGTNAIGGLAVNANFSEMNSDLSAFSQREAQNAAAQQFGSGFTCPD